MRSRDLVFFDAVLTLAAAVLSFVLRFDTLSLARWFRPMCLFAGAALVVRLYALYQFGLYRQVWRYASVREALWIATAVGVGSVVLAVLFLGVALPLRFVLAFPRSVILIEGTLSMLLLGGVRFVPRVVGEDSLEWRHPVPRARRVLVMGAGSAGAMIVREMQATPALGLVPVAFVDDDHNKSGMRIHDVPILGTRHDISKLVREQHLDEVIIAIPSASGKAIREVVSICKQVGVPFQTMPGLYEIIDGRVQVGQLREVQVEDLLRREPVVIDLHELGRFLTDATVLVTGAGGSIGSELCRQIVRFHPKRLVLFELAESNLYHIHRELRAQASWLEIVPIVGDVRDAVKVELVWSQQHPQVVFHAAAYKHVPLMECNVDEVAANNILGTRSVLEACSRHAVSRFMLISTDKAVHPKSAMGASKRIAELLVQEAAHRGGSAFLTVRFGNVLGSSGSVVPLFKEQIAAGGPVTVTHPEVERYFMTIPEAVSLIIQAAAMGVGGEIFVLDMGQPIKIRDLADDLIRLSGREPGEDIDIVYTGLRPGEKLREQLFTAEEQRLPTPHPRIFVAKPVCNDGKLLQPDLAVLRTALADHDTVKIKTELHRIISDYEA